MKLCLLHSKPIFLTLLPRQVFTVCLLYEINKGKASPWHPYFLHLPHSYSILAAFGELETQALKVDYAIWAAQKAVTKAKYEWEQAFTLMKELKLKPPLLTFRAWILATGTVSSQCLCFSGFLFMLDNFNLDCYAHFTRMRMDKCLDKQAYMGS
ncbi:hypothetical protein ES332_A01G104800v1 [Gossypium tomentosum]|uniref:Protein SET DOMAIN GROUP 40-like n=1 Tax=Gossypium tomentosum TaxID=34277 RepID=A0A5D2RPU4_GOSTO|nr:hypothetical protein ES332_A01G104800v1 [Gossypium tomentosum]